MRMSHRLYLLIALATPSLTAYSQDAGLICSTLVEEIEQFHQVEATQVEDALDAAKAILTSLMELQLMNRGEETVARNCPEVEQQEVIQQYLDTVIDGDMYVGEIPVGAIVVTGTRRGVSTAALDSSERDVPSTWRPFKFEGRTFYVVPLAND